MKYLTIFYLWILYEYDKWSFSKYYFQVQLCVPTNSPLEVLFMCYINGKRSTKTFCVELVLYWNQIPATGLPTSIHFDFTISQCINILKTVSDTTNSLATTIILHQMWVEILHNLVTRLSNHETSMIYLYLNISGLFQRLLGKIIEEGPRPWN